jgi:hypothetical protein
MQTPYAMRMSYRKNLVEMIDGLSLMVQSKAKSLVLSSHLGTTHYGDNQH